MNERWERMGDSVRRRRAENPGPMTLDGTNSYVLAAPGAPGVVVVDPGPTLEPHLAELAAAGAVELILITHHHGDHTDGSASLHQLTGAPVRAALAAFCHAGEPLSDGEIVLAAGLAVTVLATPGHTSDSVCFAVAAAAQAPQALPESGTTPDTASSPDAAVAPEPAVAPLVQQTPLAAYFVLTGDTILGSGSTVICYPDGRLGQYLSSLAALRSWALEHGTASSPVPALPGHGPVLADLAKTAQAYAEHRWQRIAQVRSAVEHLEKESGTIPSVQAVADRVYPEVPANLRAAAQLNVEAQLDYLRTGESAEM